MALSGVGPYDLAKVKNSYKDRERAALLFMARAAERAERFEDMCRFMRELVKGTNNWPDKDLSDEERSSLAISYKQVVGSARAAWRSLKPDDNKFDDLVDDYRNHLEKDLTTTCTDAISLLDSTLIKNVTKPESKVYFLKMAGDFYRYLAEVGPSKGFDKKAAELYSSAFKLAQSSLQPTHPTRLGLALNYSVCFYEVLKDKKQACELAKSAFDQAISKLDDLDEASYKDSTLIMQLLRDNLTLWTSTDQEPE